MKRKILIISGVVLALFIIGAVASEPNDGTQTNDSVTTSEPTEPSNEAAQQEQAQEPAQTEPEPVGPVAYEVVEEKDVSYQNCRRVTYKIKVADNASSESVDATQQQIIDEKKGSWNDITVWTYKESDTDEYVKNAPYTVDMAEYSTC